MDIVLVVAVVAALFLIIAAAEPLAERLRLPYAAVLAIIGILIGAGALTALNSPVTPVLTPVATAILEFPIRSNIFLTVFLPTLLFQATLGMNVRRMAEDWVPIFVLAIVAVVVATVSVGLALSWSSTLPLMACLLVGAIVSTTDPSAVVSIFRSIAAPRRLVRIIEGESLLNDAAAIALFGVFMGFVMLGVPDPDLGAALAGFPVLLIGGAAFGWLAAQAAVMAMALMPRFERAQISISIALPYLTYIGTENLTGGSGVIAVVAAGLTLNLAGPGRLSPQSWSNLREVWDLLAHWAGALIFILAALLIPRLLEGARPGDFLLVLVVILAATGARVAVLFGLLPMLTALRMSPRVDPAYRTAILWGGLRGAVTLALALAVTESFRVPLEVKRLVGILATGFTLYTLLFQGTTLRWVIARLGLDRLSPIDQALSNQVVAVALQTVREDVARATETHALDHDIARGEAKSFAERLDAAVETAEAEAEISDRDRITLGLIALAGAERDAVLDRLRERTLSARLSEQALSQADALIEGTRSDGRFGYQRAARRGAGYGLAFRIAGLLHNRLRVSGPLARLTADRFELLLTQRLIMRDLDGFIDTRIRRIHGRRVAELLHEMLARRVEEIETALEGLHLQFPGFADALERRFIRRTALRLEEREYDAMRGDGLIGPELYATLMQDIAARRATTEERPVLEVSVSRDDLVRQFPLFADLDEDALRILGRALRTRHVDAGERILRKETIPRQVYFIASGAVELELGGHVWRVGRGEMFGQMAILMRRPRRAEARAIVPTSLLMLDEARFRRLLSGSEALRIAVRQSALSQGLDIEGLPEIA